MPIDGYARVSTDGQWSEGRPQRTHEGAQGDYRVGDTLIVTRLDRLARSTRDLLNILDIIARAGASFRSLGDPWTDTTTPHGRLMLTVLGGLAEFERELIVARTGEGRARAKARGQHMSRLPMLTAHQRSEALPLWCDELEHPERFSNPALIDSIKREGVAL
jgi:DNA invertase Pin-like site-specific DNA recombinase